MEEVDGLVLNRGIVGVDFGATLQQLGVTFEFQHRYSEKEGIWKYIGEISHLPKILTETEIKTGMQVWYCEDSWMPIGRLEFDRWQVDVIDGEHWIVCCRPIEYHFESHNSNQNVVVWSRDDLTKLIGDAMLKGLIGDFSIESFLSQERVEINPIDDWSAQQIPLGPIAISPEIEIDDILKDKGLSGIPLEPVLLECWLWFVDGVMEGPNGTSNERRWILKEDPFDNSLKVIEKPMSLPHAPKIQSLGKSSCLSEQAVINRLPKLCDERKSEKMANSSDDGVSLGNLMRWWRINVKNAKLHRLQLLQPAWFGTFPIEGSSLLHGGSGEIIPYQR